MLKEVFSYIKKMVPAVLAGIVVCIVFVSYMVAIGIPKTKARNLYNQGVIAIQEGDIGLGKQRFAEAIAAWPETYIIAELEALGEL